MTSTLEQLQLIAIPQQPGQHVQWGLDITGPMTREAFERVVSRARAILETCGPDTAWEELKALGFAINVLHVSRSTMQQIWEAADITAHNTACGDRGILSQQFYTLYADVVEYGAGSRLGTRGYVEFLSGRIGNTCSLEFEAVIVDVDKQPCDRCGAWSEAFSVIDHGTDLTGYRDEEIVCGRCIQAGGHSAGH